MQKYMLARVMAKYLSLLSITFLLFCGSASAEFNSAQERQVIRMFKQMLETESFVGQTIDDNSSQLVLTHLLKELDPRKLTFLKSDVEGLKYKFGTELDDALTNGAGAPIHEIADLYETRWNMRVKAIEELLDGSWDFTVEESLSKFEDYATTPEELQERWRKAIKFELLQKKLEKDPGEPLTQADKNELANGYKMVLRAISNKNRDDEVQDFLDAWGALFDPHTNYLSPQKFKNFKISISNELIGIGAELKMEEGYPTVSRVIPNGPADKDGRLKPNDRIVAVASDGNAENAIPVRNKHFGDSVNLIRGTKGTKVYLRILTENDEQVEYTLVRGTVKLEDQKAHGDLLEYGEKTSGDTYKIGILSVPSFYRGLTEDMKRIIGELKERAQIDVLLVDLRNNGGGLLTEAVTSVGLFIKSGPVVKVKSRFKEDNTYEDTDGGAVAWDGLLAVITNDMSASASEIFAGAIKDYKRGLIIGSSTYGKGSVQSLMSFARALFRKPELLGIDPTSLGAMKLTIQQYYRPNGESVQGKGVLTDVSLPSLLETQITKEKDVEGAIAFDSIDKLEFTPENSVDQSLAEKLNKKSQNRQKASAEFKALKRAIRLAQKRKDQPLSLNEATRRNQRKQIGEMKHRMSFFEKNEAGDFTLALDSAGEMTRFRNQELLQVVMNYVDLSPSSSPELAASGY